MSDRADKVARAWPLTGAYDITGNTQVNTAISGNYTYNTAGNATGFMFKSPTTANLTSVDMFAQVRSASGNYRIEVRESDYGSSPKPVSGTALGSATVAANAAASNTWISGTGMTAPLSRNHMYFAIIGTDGTSTGTIITTTSGGTSAAGNDVQIAQRFTTNTGFTNTPSLAIAQLAPLILTFDDGTVYGMGPYTIRVTSGGVLTGSGWQGLRISNVTEDFTIKGIQVAANSMNNVLTVAIFKGAAGPFDAPEVSETLPVRSCEDLSTIYFENDYVFEAGSNYRIVVAGAANMSVWYYSIQDEASITARAQACAMGQGTFYGTYQNGTTWTDDTTILPWISLIRPFQGTGDDDVPPDEPDCPTCETCSNTNTTNCGGVSSTNTSNTNTTIAGDQFTSLIDGGVCRADIRIAALIDGVVVSTLEGDLPNAGGHLTFPFTTRASGRYCQLYIRMCVCGSDSAADENDDDDVTDPDDSCTIPSLLGYYVEVAGPVGARMRTKP